MHLGCSSSINERQGSNSRRWGRHVIPAASIEFRNGSAPTIRKRNPIPRVMISNGRTAFNSLECQDNGICIGGNGGDEKQQQDASESTRKSSQITPTIFRRAEGVSADLKKSESSRFRCAPESLPVVAEHTNSAAAVRNKQSRL
jgi:hypothetical protein